MTEQHRVTSHTTVRIKDLTYEASHNGGPSNIITNLALYTYYMLFLIHICILPLTC
jgi:hypothetical protein